MMERLVQRKADFDILNGSDVSARTLARNFHESYSKGNYLDSGAAVRDFEALIELMGAGPQAAIGDSVPTFSSTSSLTEILDQGICDGALTSKATGALRVKFALMRSETVNQRFAEDHPDERLRGSTLMHLTVQLRSTTLLRELINQGADVELANVSGVSALQLARENLEAERSRHDIGGNDRAMKYSRMVDIMESHLSARAKQTTTAKTPDRPKPARRFEKVVTKAERERRKQLIRDAQAAREEQERRWWEFWK